MGVLSQVDVNGDNRTGEERMLGLPKRETVTGNDSWLFRRQFYQHSALWQE